MRGRHVVSIRHLSSVTLAVGVATIACGSTVTSNPEGDGAGAFLDAREAYADAVDDSENLPACEHLATATDEPSPPWHHADEWDGGCYVELQGVDTHWTTYCEGTACHCLENGEPLCACQTEVAWCEVPSSSCCPSPWP